ncbi:hypothetical protein BGW36DRAFT_85689 [Talaromyces proteolyticus]|uniref:Uncharacterized protein n=1 Tax=Talaromyces proteolyticus TaxID=1131652 RepID=A0AAD4KZ93_9EURO|nr:uncharacterized protein BGW36DRAFT_85689 [Talaromyces proteolyticus]KAH8703349.1 hypothetical protein BGW36DRAFT_85689 [Talaromyces proteolyticus]
MTNALSSLFIMGFIVVCRNIYYGQLPNCNWSLIPNNTRGPLKLTYFSTTDLMGVYSLLTNLAILGMLVMP